MSAATTKVSQVMTENVRTVDVKEGLQAVRQVLQTEPFHHVPIVDGGALVGIISSRDMLRIYRDAADDARASIDADRTIAEVMQTELVTMRPDESVDRAIDALADGEIHSLLIVDRDEQLVGILTNVDLMKFLFD